jgi:hypothetical protein
VAPPQRDPAMGNVNKSALITTSLITVEQFVFCDAPVEKKLQPQLKLFSQQKFQPQKNIVIFSKLQKLGKSRRKI